MIGWRETIRKNPILRWSLLFSNWFFQGIRNADTTEKYYKILFTVLFTGVFFFVFDFDDQAWSSELLFAFICGHTLNWLVNGPIAAVFIHRLFIGKIKKGKLFRYLQDLENRVERNNAISYCAVFGSIARGELKDSSDIDVGFLRKPGLINAFGGLYFITKERIHTNLAGIPFEGYLVDSLENMVTRFRKENVPVVLKQSESMTRNSLPIGISLAAAHVLNKKSL